MWHEHTFHEFFNRSMYLATAVVWSRNAMPAFLFIRVCVHSCSVTLALTV
jgi:hypothetical protein